jgi:hypothetical protein
VKPGLKEDLGAVDVADARHARLVHQHLPDSGTSHNYEESQKKNKMMTVMILACGEDRHLDHLTRIAMTMREVR